jgi:hypothetical protein
MGRRASLELRELWVQRLKRQGTSDLSIAGFCENEGISVSGFYAWKRRLKDVGKRSTATVRPRGDATSANGQAIRPSRNMQPPAAGQSNQPVSAGTFFQVPVVVGHEQVSVDFELVDGTVVRVPASNFGAIELMLKTLAGNGGRPLSGGPDHA